MSNLRSELLSLATALGLAACATQPTPTSAPAPNAGGSGPIEKDAYECRTTAEAEANRRYPIGSNFGAWNGYGTNMSQTQDWVNRGNLRDGVFNNCMAAKGYSRQQYENLSK